MNGEPTTTCRRAIRRSLGVLGIWSVLAVALAGPAAATWSVVGVDPDTGEVGVAVASCVPSFALGDLTSPLGFLTLAPGKGAGVSQAWSNSDVPPVMQRMLNDSASTPEIVAAVSAESFDSDFALRQHGVVTIDGQASGYTGAENDAVALDRQAPNVTVQGNLLVSEDVVADALAAFQDPQNPDLAARLVAALQAGADAGGDARCGAQTALFAQVVVADRTDDPDAPTTMLITTVDEGDGQNPVDLLTAEFARGERQTSVLLATETAPPAVALLIARVGALLLVIAIGALVWKFARRPQDAS